MGRQAVAHAELPTPRWVQSPVAETAPGGGYCFAFGIQKKITLTTKTKIAIGVPVQERQ